MSIGRVSVSDTDTIRTHLPSRCIRASWQGYQGGGDPGVVVARKLKNLKEDLKTCSKEIKNLLGHKACFAHKAILVLIKYNYR